MIGATEQVYGHIQQARSESIARSDDVHVNFSASGSTTWSYGIGLGAGDCTVSITNPVTPNACVLVVDDGDADNAVHGVDGSLDTGDLVLMRFTSDDHQDIKMTVTMNDGGSAIAFNRLRGTAEISRVQLESDDGKQLRIDVGLLGQVKICSPGSDVAGYGAC